MNTAPIDAARIAEHYIALWNEADASRRRELLESHWLPDASYVDPMMQACGHQQIDGLVQAVHQRFPGFRFRLKGQPDAHGEHLRFSWMLGPDASHDLVEGTDFVELRAGKLRSVTGFLDKVPVGA
ncbi:MAG: nuclear transport factor 2 family protein [Gammaproteobacteria bacterium]|nr:nuclear transport factor 2 family protein [Gammaproteobacteria bacterium]MBU1439879.1 nuclear transport factor 2 family protein [Gammaproteobacteria bacterium]MBU2409895.1 nuclear transport factor 2 family protein [Gammaproteobacteria bacterium]